MFKVPNNTNMQSREKRVKSSAFFNSQEAGEYVDSILEMQPNLPLSVWTKILSFNNDLTMKDIHRMCKARPDTFGRVCTDGTIWEEVFKVEFGMSDFMTALQLAPNTENYNDRVMLALMVWRIMKRFKDRPNNFISMGSQADVEISVELDEGSTFDTEQLANGTFRKINIRKFPRITIRLGGEKVNKNSRITKDLTLALNDPSDSYGSLYRPMGARKDRMISVFEWNFENDFPMDRLLFLVFYYALKNRIFPQEKFYYNRTDALVCGACGMTAKYKCGGCKDISYCSEKCANLDWPVHACQ